VGTISGEDLDAWVRMALNGSIFFINRELVRINVVNEGVLHVSNRLDGEFDYTQWLKYRAGSSREKLWLAMYALKKNYKTLKKSIVVRFPWIYRLRYLNQKGNSNK